MIASSSLNSSNSLVCAEGGVRSMYSIGAWIPLAMASAIFFEFPVGEKLITLTDSIFNINSLNKFCIIEYIKI